MGTIDHRNEMRRLVRMGVDDLITDRPDLALRATGREVSEALIPPFVAPSRPTPDLRVSAQKCFVPRGSRLLLGGGVVGFSCFWSPRPRTAAVVTAWASAA